MNKRILHIIPTLSKGGAEKQLRQLLTDQSSSNFSHSVLLLIATEKDINLSESDEVTVHLLNLRRPVKFITGIVPLLLSIIRWKPDIIQGWMFHSHIIAILIWLILFGKPELYWNVRTTYIPKHYKPTTKFFICLNKFLSRIPASIIYNSHEGKRSFEKYGFALNGIVIPNAFNSKAWNRSHQARIRLRRQWEINDNTFVIGIVGRYDSAKGYPIILEAIKLVMDSGASKIHFVFAGRELGPENPTLKPAFADNKICNNCHFVGEQNDLQLLYSAFDAFLSGSLREGFSNVLAEAMLMKLPAIATNVGDNTLILLPECGQLVPPGNSIELSNAILALHSMLPKQREEMGIRARRHIENKYSLHDGISAYYKLYSN